MEDTECMNKFVKVNYTISFFVKKIKNLQVQAQWLKYIEHSKILDTDW